MKLILLLLPQWSTGTQTAAKPSAGPGDENLNKATGWHPREAALFKSFTSQITAMA